MRRFVSLAVLLFFTVPFGASLVGCGHKTITQYCNGLDSGPIVGQAKSITLSPNFATYGESLDYGQIGSSLSASAVDCKGSPVSVRSYTFATSDMSFADVNPSTGQVCGGTWNRNTGGGIPDYTVCTAPATLPDPAVAKITATAEGGVSNAFNAYIHPKVTGIVIGNPTSNCSTDPDTSCCPVSTGAVVVAPPYQVGGSCLSQGVTRQITARAYKNGTTDAADNITCKIGHLQYGAQNLSVLTVDQNGVATAAQPGSSIITATVTNSGSGGAAGFWSTCPPAFIDLQIAGGGLSATVNQNNNQPLTAVVKDTKGVTLTGINLTFTSTSPSTIPAGTGTVIPALPGSAAITAVCQPPSCNSAPFSQIGFNGNGKPLTSNPVQITTPGTNASVLYIGSTQSQYLLPVDFSTGQPGTLIKLPYVPNSMVITQDGSTIYLGSSSALMTVSAINNQVSGSNQAVTGTVLSVSPDGSTVVVTDPVRQTVSLVSSAGAISSTNGGVGVRAQWTPDSQTVYIASRSTTSGPQLLVHSSYNGWIALPTANQYTDVAVMVPSVGAFFATDTNITEGRSYCPTSVVGAAGNPPDEINSFYPVANDTAVQTDRIAATNDQKHILGATVHPAPALNDITVQLTSEALNCPIATTGVIFGTSVVPHALTGVAATAITGVFPTADSSLAFVTYTGTSGLLPVYLPGTGAISFLPLSGGATSAPVSGVFSTDNKTFFAGTSGDNQVHLITVNGTTATDSSVITPKLPDANNNPVVPNLLVQRPKKTTS